MFTSGKMSSIQRMLKELMMESDKLIRAEAKAPAREKEWFAMIKERVQRIADGRLPEEFDSSNDSESTIPSCLTFIKGKTETYGMRVSAYFPRNERGHLHKKKTNTSKNKLSANSHTTPRSSRTRSSKNEKNSRQSVGNKSESKKIEEPNPQAGLDKTFVKDVSPGELVTPDRKNKFSPPSSLRGETKSGRLSGAMSKIRSLEQEMFQKKLKTMSVSREPHLVVRSSRFSLGKKKLSGLRDTHRSSALASRSSSKTSAIGKRDTLQCREDAAAENLKKIQNARRKKIEESKKMRDEKMERTREKRMKMEKAKTLSAKQKTSETVIRSTRAQERNTDARARSRESKEKSDPTVTVKSSLASSKKTTRSESAALRSGSKSKGTTTLSKTPKPKEALASKNKKTMPKESPTSSKTRRSSSKTPMQKDSSDSSKKGGSSSPVLRTPSSVKGRRPTPPMKAQPLKLTPNPTIVTVQNTTVVIEKQTEIKSSPRGSLRKRSVTTPTSPPATKNVKSPDKTASIPGKKLNKSPSPKPSKKVKLEQTATTPKAQPSGDKKPDSYELTPDRSSFTSYDMSEIVSDDDDETTATQKPIPSWAMGLRLRNALLNQYYNPVNTDELFGNVWETPNLEQMFNIKKKNYHKRTSSAVWQSPRAFK